MIIAGDSLLKVATEYPTQFIRYGDGFKKLKSCLILPRSTMTQGLWFSGSTGIGKSLQAMLVANDVADGEDDVFYKSDMSHWWCGYAGQSVVVWNDFRWSQCPNGNRSVGWLLNLIDRYPHKVQVKNGSCQFRAKLVIITAPVPMTEMFEELTSQEGQMDQLARRFKSVAFTAAHKAAAIAWANALAGPMPVAQAGRGAGWIADNAN